MTVLVAPAPAPEADAATTGSVLIPSLCAARAVKITRLVVVPATGSTRDGGTLSPGAFPASARPHAVKGKVQQISPAASQVSRFIRSPLLATGGRSFVDYTPQRSGRLVAGLHAASGGR